ncbi:MAG: hypothetical protein IT285_10385 [Bdellovibrionales bacterium]|nr:hypothetical protein [Bdellovibrionales bacterium]
MFSSLRPFHRLGALPLFAILATGCPGGLELTIPERHLLVSTPNFQGASPEVRLSDDGIRWSGPRALTLSSGANAPAAPGVPAGVAANDEGYLVAYFDPSGNLRTSSSDDGLRWVAGPAHGQFAVDAASRPSVSFNYDTGTWGIAFREVGGQIVTLGVGGAPIGASRVPGASSSQPISLTWKEGNWILAWATQGFVGIALSADLLQWPTANRGAAEDPNGNLIFTQGGPSIGYSLGTLRLSVNRVVQGSPSFGTGEIEILQSDDAFVWRREDLIARTNPFSTGTAFSGPASELVVADIAAGVTGTQMHLNGRAGVRLETRTQNTVSLAFGPKEPADSPEGLKDLHVTFRRFKRSFPSDPFDTEDLLLEAEVLAIDGRVLHTMPPWEMENIYTNAGHLFSEGTAPIRHPELGFLVQPGETLRVRLTGSDGTVQQHLSYAELIGPASPTGEKTFIAGCAAGESGCDEGAIRYQVWFSTSLR